MYCVGSCLVGAILIGSMLTVMISKNSEAESNFKKLLTEQQYDKYCEIYKQRLKIFLQGMLLGILLALGYSFIFAKEKTALVNACAVTAIIIGTAYLYYMLLPKEMMLNSLTTAEQIRAWTDVYKKYRFRSTLGMILGIIGYFLLIWGFYQ